MRIVVLVHLRGKDTASGSTDTVLLLSSGGYLVTSGLRQSTLGRRHRVTGCGAGWC